MLKKLVLYALILFMGIVSPVFAGGGNEIIVIGTVHESTNSYNADSLLSIFQSVNPDIILVECDSSYMTPDFKLKNEVKDIAVETKAITRYLTEKEIGLRPYDINGRDSVLDDPLRIVNQYGLFNDIQELYGLRKYSNKAVAEFDKISGMMQDAEKMSGESPLFINGAGRKMIDTINYYSYDGISKLISLTPELSKYSDYWRKENIFWKKRNAVMVENIVKYNKEFEGKRIIVLCGFAHKNIISGELSKLASAENITLKEYWEYFNPEYQQDNYQ